MTTAVQLVAGGLRLIATAATVYVTHGLLVALAVVPAGLRSYQLFHRDGNAWLELLVGLQRVVLVAAMIAIVRGWATPLAAGAEWRRLGSDISHALRTGWAPIMIRLTVVTLVALAFGAAVEAVLDLGWAPSRQAADAIVFAVKNAVVIPVYLMAILHSLHVVPSMDRPVSGTPDS